MSSQSTESETPEQQQPPERNLPGKTIVESIKSLSAENRDQRLPILVLAVSVLLLVVAYGDSLARTVHAWDQPLYSHGYVVPIFALILLWMRRERITWASTSARWAGLGLFAFGLGLRAVSARYNYVTPDMVSFVPSLAGLFLLIGGWSLIRWAGPAILFLLFMFPLPDFVKSHVLMRLQGVATIISTYVLQTLGIAAYHEGNIITVGKAQLEVVDACSGLRMTTVLLALVVAILLIVKRPWWDRLIIVLSAVPLAITVNIIRITAMGLAHAWIGESFDPESFHDWTGLAMMPLAIGLLWIEIEILSRLVVDIDDGAQLAASGGTVQGARETTSTPAG